MKSCNIGGHAVGWCYLTPGRGLGPAHTLQHTVVGGWTATSLHLIVGGGVTMAAARGVARAGIQHTIVGFPWNENGFDNWST